MKIEAMKDVQSVNGERKQTVYSVLHIVIHYIDATHA